MRYLINGGEFNNKGAEAMTLVALSVIFKHDAEAEVYLANVPVKCPYSLKYKVNYVTIPVWLSDLLLGKRTKLGIGSFAKELLKFVLPGKKSVLLKTKKTRRIISSTDIMIDISGFAFSSKFKEARSVLWLDMISLMKKNDAKVYIMPQSFGPFDYKDKSFLQNAKKVLAKCDLIYAREQEGYDLLKDMGLSNIQKSPDSVLITKEYDPTILVEDYSDKCNIISSINEHSVSIIPNYRLIDRGGFNVDRLMEFYISSIDKILKKHYVYLIAHAKEDLAICRKIKDSYIDENRVVLVDKVLPSFVFEKMMDKMDYVIASRYHSVVHAYKKCTPAIILGWAEKYSELADIVGQEKYLIKLSDDRAELGIIEEMEKKYNQESSVITERIESIQKENCYLWLEDLIIAKEDM